ncbi:hypothetical protein LMG33818_002185 [Halomonadaceae bacterium LMG 33818]|uniref:hypothetical protein n=1 Tax=Cernens ardua TaxID=3402176 RepID=UPI003EDC3841
MVDSISSNYSGVGYSSAADTSGSQETTESASRQLEGYFEGKGQSTFTLNDLKDLAANKGGNVPKDIQQAASFLSNSDNAPVWSAIEQHDVPNQKDNLSSLSNLDWAAHGGLEGSSAQLQAQENEQSSLLKELQGLQTQLNNVGTNQSPSIQSTSQTLLSYLQGKGQDVFDTSDLQNMADNKGGSVPKDVQQAAQYYLNHPGVWSAVETHDVAGADGKSGLGNLEFAADGGFNNSSVQQSANQQDKNQINEKISQANKQLQQVSYDIANGGTTSVDPYLNSDNTSNTPANNTSTTTTTSTTTSTGSSAGTQSSQIASLEQEMQNIMQQIEQLESISGIGTSNTSV